MSGEDDIGWPLRHTEPWQNHGREPTLAGGEASLVDLLDRLIAGGVVISGDIALSIAGVDLVHISLRALITSVKAGGPPPAQW